MKSLRKIPNWIWLLVLACVPYLIFLNLRVLRMAGDEKVYISQAIEMARSGRWFIQTLADDPSYFKGPLHYILVRIGLMVFGNQLWAGLWMNLAFAALAALSLYQVGKKFLSEKSAFLLGLAQALNVGIFSHSFASQMEVELFAFYNFAIFFLASRSKYADLGFWLVAGIAGWVKSPAHSVLIVMGAVTFWVWNRDWKIKLKTPQFWLFAFAGITVGVLGYLPAALLDYRNFYDTFIIRENFGKANNNRQWDYVMMPIFHFLFPWTFLILAASFQFVKKFYSTKIPISPYSRLGLSMAIPTIIFWCSWTYKGQNYNLPALGGLLLFAWSVWKDHPPRWALRITGICIALVTAAFFVLMFHFKPLPSWWDRSWIFTSFFALILSGLIFACYRNLEKDWKRIALGASALFVAFGAVITPLGERELSDAKSFLEEHPSANLYYYDLDPSIWSEWGLLQLSLHRPIYGMHKRSQFTDVFKENTALLLNSKAALEDVLREWHKLQRNQPPQISLWARWLTKAKSPSGESQLLHAWKKKDFSPLERTFYIFYVEPSSKK